MVIALHTLTNFSVFECLTYIGTEGARSISTLRTLDELDRVTLVDYPDDTLDVTYTYDDPLAPFSLGRLTQIERDGQPIDYQYDRFGRMTQDGELAYAFDTNGNKSEILYPGGVRAIYTFDHADRHQTLDAEVPGQGIQAIVTGALYKAIGPLRQLTRGNGVTESRQHDSRYRPASITAVGPGGTLLDWDYTTDGVGNITAISDLLDSLNNRTYAYQDYQYFLTQGDGPWGALTWAYDKIGNRLSQTRDGATDIYQYLANAAASGNTAKLDQIALGAGGSRVYTFDAAGNQTGVDEDGDPVTYTFDDAGRLSAIDHPSAQASSTMLYDGRSYLRQAVGSEPDTSGNALFCDGFESGDISAWGDPGASSCTAEAVTEAAYSSDAVLQRRAGATEANAVLYFGGQPVAQTGGAIVTHLTADHLGTPVLASSNVGASDWSGGFEPFGSDYANAGDAGVFLRFPGQWDDAAWDVDSPFFFNVLRWYQSGTGNYSRPDPLGAQGDFHPYLYATANPLFFVDPTGEKSRVCCTPITQGQSLAAFKHCFIQTEKKPGDPSGESESVTFGLQSVRRKGCKFKNDFFDTDRVGKSRTECGPWSGDDDCETDPCVAKQFENYPNPSNYQLLRGPNSNSFASTVAGACGLTPPSVAGTIQTPGWGKQGRPAKNKNFKCPEHR